DNSSAQESAEQGGVELYEEVTLLVTPGLCSKGVMVFSGLSSRIALSLPSRVSPMASLNNVTEIRADALKLLVMLKRPEPRAAATIGAWLNIFQFLVVMAICTNCLLLVCLYDEEGKWRIEPGLAAILIMEHALLLIKFGFSHFVPK
ncbi:hypothetical protein ACJX0J_033910, partial [Zea mays]